MAIIKVDLQKSYRILNPGATTLVSAKHGDDVNGDGDNVGAGA